MRNTCLSSVSTVHACKCVILQKQATEEEVYFHNMWNITKGHLLYDVVALHDCLHFVWFSNALHCRLSFMLRILRIRFAEISLWRIISMYFRQPMIVILSLSFLCFFVPNSFPFFLLFLFVFVSSLNFFHFFVSSLVLSFWPSFFHSFCCLSFLNPLLSLYCSNTFFSSAFLSCRFSTFFIYSAFYHHI